MPHSPDTLVNWLRQMQKGVLFRPGERVGVAVSGGPDSILLLEFMRHLAREMGLRLAVVHFNHHLRGAESESDEQFVQQQARNLQVEFFQGEADVARVAHERHRNLEATGRELRYRFFFSLANQGKLDKVATAHTANDQAETVLLRLLRGAGARGLGGLFPVLDGKVVRPFLDLTRAEVESELRRRKLEFRLDSSNVDSRFLRNKVRSQLLPLLEKDFNPQIVRSLVALAARARDEEGYLEQAATERARPWRVREGRDEKIPVRALLDLPRAIARYVLRQMISAVLGDLRGVTYHHIESLLQFASKAQSGRTLALPGGCLARKEFDWLVIAPQPPQKADPEFAYPLQVPGDIYVPELGAVFHFQILDSSGPPKSYNTSGVGVGYLDADKLSGDLVLRNWRAGDRFQPSGSRRARRIKELFSRRRVPVGERRHWPVLECRGEIIWMRGFPPARSWLAVPSSRRALKISEDFEGVGPELDRGRPHGG